MANKVEQDAKKMEQLSERLAALEHRPPVKPERKGGKRLTRIEAAAYVQHCGTDFSAFVQMDKVRPDNPDAKPGDKYHFTTAALDNFLATYAKQERTDMLREWRERKNKKTT